MVSCCKPLSTRLALVSAGWVVRERGHLRLVSERGYLSADERCGPP
jgi:hypothetical protein